MRFLKTSEYAIRVLVFMMRNGDGRYSVAHLHRELKISHKYLGRLMPRLAESGFLEAIRGKGGGYVIPPSARSVTLGDVVEAVEGLEDFERCVLGLPTCSDTNPCPLHTRWSTHRSGIKEMLFSTRLGDLASEPGGKR